MLVTATDVPNLSNVTSMSLMFYFATSANPNVENWAVSNVINMSSMFFRTSSANPNTSNWAVSNVINMSFMFKNSNL